MSMPLTAVAQDSGSVVKLNTSELAVFNAMEAAGGPEGHVADMHAFAMKKWAAARQAGFEVAAVGSDADNFYVAVLRPEGDGWQVIAMANPDNDPVVVPADVSVLEDLSLDVITYGISKTEIAFGVRVSTDFTSTSTYAVSTVLHLFRMHDGQLNDIFEAEVSSSTCDKTAPETACPPDQSAIIKFAATQHNGFYDIILKPLNNRKGKSLHYVWQNGAYTRMGPQSLN